MNTPMIIGMMLTSIIVSIIGTLGYTSHKAIKLSKKNQKIIDSFKDRIAGLEDNISELEDCLTKHNK